MLSIGSAGSFLSFGSAGTVRGIGSAGTVRGIGSADTGRAREERGRPATPLRVVDLAGTLLGIAALVAACRRA